MTGLHHGSERCSQINGEGIALGRRRVRRHRVPADRRHRRCLLWPRGRLLAALGALSYEYFLTTRDNAGRRSSPRTGVGRASRARCSWWPCW
jgi:hypothetical protein